MINKIDVLWDDEPIDVTAEANFIWSIANKLRGSYMAHILKVLWPIT